MERKQDLIHRELHMSKTILFVGNEQRLIEQLTEVAQAHEHRLYTLTDAEHTITSEEDAVQAVQRIQTKLGPIGVFVWGAFYHSPIPFGQLSEADYQSYMHRAVHTPFYFSRACIKSMERQRFGRILFLTSIVATLGDPDFLFTAASGALNTLAKSIAREEARKGITANALALGCIEDSNDLNTSLVKRFYQHYYPYREIFTFAQLAQSIVHLIEDKTTTINGQILKLDGGTL
jgi:NAD(P)-dependent dehydrogenase (short-subunit alcohol dehydrogenase family)